MKASLQIWKRRFYGITTLRNGGSARSRGSCMCITARCGALLCRAGVPPPQHAPRSSKVDPYLPFIRETLERFPTLTAIRLYVMVRERGYRGKPRSFPASSSLSTDRASP